MTDRVVFSATGQLTRMIDPSRLLLAYEKARADLLAERTAAGHWEGRLSSSALSTATAVSALAIATRMATSDSTHTTPVPQTRS